MTAENHAGEDELTKYKKETDILMQTLEDVSAKLEEIGSELQKMSKQIDKIDEGSEEDEKSEL